MLGDGGPRGRRVARCVSTVRARLEIGGRTYDVTHRALVMGILNRTPDSFYDHGATYDLDALVDRAARLVTEGADVLDVGGVKAGPGPEVGEAEELDRVIPAIEALAARFDTALSVDTWRASVARAAYRAGAVVGNDISGFADAGYLPAAAAAGASVVATHIRLAPRVRDPEPRYADVVAEVGEFLAERASRAEAAGIAADRIVLDAGLDLGKTAVQSLALLRASAELAARLPPPALGVQQDLSRGPARPRDRPAPDRRRWPRRPSGVCSAVGSCGCTTWPGPAVCATRWLR